ncbi:hypothetical protein BGZ74_003601, partial [Mortierella antarctica]
MHESENKVVPNPIGMLMDLVFGNILDDPWDDLFDYSAMESDPVDDLLQELILSSTCRYIDRPAQYRQNTVDIVDKIANFSAAECKSVLRMSWKSFQKLTALLFDHEVFQTAGPRQQEEVSAQLAVTLDRLGHNGTGMSPIRFGLFWGRSPNACSDFYTRGIQAILSLDDRYAAWPTPVQRAAHSELMATKGFAGCTKIYNQPERYFSEGEYVIGDSAYPVTQHCVPVIKGVGLSKDERDFNR